ncbi:MAG: hypothetical protein K2I69_08470 [Muribaculaceae bacterium]|nr:hypothetical protein [Muribaculaceae bacterium]
MNKQLLQSAYSAWSAAEPLRARRERYKKYTYGDQWSDIIPDSRGRKRSEYDTIVRSGGKPLTNNLIRQLVKTIVGRFRAISEEKGLYADSRISTLAAENELPELDSRLLEEFLISGCAVQRVSSETRYGTEGVWVDNVDIRKFFVNRFLDPRGRDIDMLGMLHELSFPEIASRFGGGDTRRIESLRKLFATLEHDGAFAGESIGEPSGNPAFFCSSRAGRFRVVELWTLDSAEKRNGKRTDFTFRWHCRWLAADGTLLGEYDSPYAHGSHPFVLRFYPLTDGEVHSFVEDVVEQQRCINRLIVLIDRVLSSSAKGVLLFPRNQMVDNFSWEDITERWASADGVIPISGLGQHLPQQVATTNADTGAYKLLELQMKLFENISGVGDALSGRAGVNAKGAEMYNTQVENATIALADIFSTFTAFTQARNSKACASITRGECVRDMP